MTKYYYLVLAAVVVLGVIHRSMSKHVYNTGPTRPVLVSDIVLCESYASLWLLSCYAAPNCRLIDLIFYHNLTRFAIKMKLRRNSHATATPCDSRSKCPRATKRYEPKRTRFAIKVGMNSPYFKKKVYLQ